MKKLIKVNSALFQMVQAGTQHMVAAGGSKAFSSPSNNQAESELFIFKQPCYL